MKQQWRRYVHGTGVSAAQGRRAWLRVVAMICVVTLCLTTVGCAGYVSREEFEQLEAAYADAGRAIEALEGENAVAAQEIETLKTENAAAAQEIDALVNENAVAMQEIDMLKGNNVDAMREIDALKGDNAAAAQEIDALKGDNAAAAQEIDALKQLVEELKASLPSDSGDQRIRIYIDQGHNPSLHHNSGGVGNGLYEQDLTFAIGRMLAALLAADGRFAVKLSRPTESTVLGTDNASSLQARVDGAKAFDADYFISLHTNAFSAESAHGIEVLVAAPEGTSYDFGSSLLEGMVASTGLRNRGMKLRPDLHVLKNATMPAVLLEMGFITNPTDAALLAQSPELFAQGIYDGILAYFGFLPRASNE